MRLNYFVCGEYALLDQIKNKITIVGITDTIQSQQFPAIMPNFAFVIGVSRNPDEPEEVEGTTTFKIGEEIIVQGPSSVHFQGSLRSRIITNIPGLVIPSPGLIVARLNLGDLIGEWSIDAEQVAPAAFQQILPLNLG